MNDEAGSVVARSPRTGGSESAIDESVRMPQMAIGPEIMEEEMGAISDQLLVTTDDGSYGVKGFVTDELARLLEEGVSMAVDDFRDLELEEGLALTGAYT